MDRRSLHLLREKLRRLQRELGWQQKNDASCCGVTVARCHALLEIGRQEEISLAELAEVLGLDASTLSRTVENLVREGLVLRRSNPLDRRFVSLTLSSRGAAVKDEIDRTYDRYFSAVCERIPPDKHGQVLESIIMLVEALSHYNRERPDSCCGEEL